MSAFAFIRILREDRPGWWVVLGLALGFGALGKYNMIFFVPPVAMTILAFSALRPLVGTGRFWIMVLLAFLGTLPILIWNHQHDWISFRFQFRHGFTPSNRSVLTNVGEFLGGQLGTVGLLLFPLLWFVCVRGVRDGWRQQDPVRFFLGMLPLPMMVFFSYTGLSAKVEANWPQVAYLSGMVLAAEWLLAGPTSWRWRVVLGPNILMLGLICVQALTLAIPVRPGHDVSTRLHGWEQMGVALRDLDRKTGHKLC